VANQVNNITKLPFDLDRLSGYLGAHIDCGSARDIPELTPIAGGFSNPTFFLKYSDTANYVIRKKPAGKLLPSAHAIDREYRVMSALAQSDIAVPQMLHYCEDATIIGTPFYVMERIEGRVLHNNYLPEIDPQDRSAYFSAMNKTLADLHNVDYAAVGLEGFGKQGGFIKRQIALWSSQYQKSKTADIPDIIQLGRWLEDNIPNDDETTIVHGDYRLGNLMFHPSEPKIVGVLDWELSTLGHPLSDLGYNLMIWKMRSDEFHGIADLDATHSGLPLYEDYIHEYLNNRGANYSFNPFYLAFSFFRLAVIFDGIVRRGGTVDAHPGIDVTTLNRTFSRIGLSIATA